MRIILDVCEVTEALTDAIRRNEEDMDASLRLERKLARNVNDATTRELHCNMLARRIGRTLGRLYRLREALEAV